MSFEFIKNDVPLYECSMCNLHNKIAFSLDGFLICDICVFLIIKCQWCKKSIFIIDAHIMQKSLVCKRCLMNKHKCLSCDKVINNHNSFKHQRSKKCIKLKTSKLFKKGEIKDICNICLTTETDNKINCSCNMHICEVCTIPYTKKYDICVICKNRLL